MPELTRLTAAIWGVKHGPSHDNFGYFDFSGSLTSIFSKSSHQNSFKFSGFLEGKNVFQSRENDATGVTEL